MFMTVFSEYLLRSDNPCVPFWASAQNGIHAAGSLPVCFAVAPDKETEVGSFYYLVYITKISYFFSITIPLCVFYLSSSVSMYLLYFSYGYYVSLFAVLFFCLKCSLPHFMSGTSSSSRLQVKITPWKEIFLDHLV